MKEMVERKLRVLFVADVSPAQVIGGAERVLYEHMSRLAKIGHEVSCLARSEEEVKDNPVRMDGIAVHHFRSRPGMTPLFFLSSLWRCRKAFKSLLKNNSFDLIILHQPLSALGVLTASKSWQIPRKYTFHSLWFREYEVRLIKKHKDDMAILERVFSWFWIQLNIRLRKIIERICLKAVSEIIVLSEFSKAQIIKYHGVPASRISLIPGGVDIKQFFPLPEKERQDLSSLLGLPQDVFLLLTVRNLEPRMGLDSLIKAMAEVALKATNVFLIIGGKGSLEKELKSLTAQLGLEEYIRFEGFIPEEKLASYYQAADLFILPTRCLEGFGLVTLEALACGTPVLGTPVGGTVEILSKLDPELLFKSTEPDDMVEKILQFISLPRQYLTELRGKCRQCVVEHYDWDKIMPDYMHRVWS